MVTLASVWATFTLKMEMIPDIDLPITTVVTVYPRATPEEIMNEVTVPIEGAISDIGGLRHIVSTSVDGISFIFVEFEYGTDMGRVNDTISENLRALGLPQGVRDLDPDILEMAGLEENPQLFAIDMNSFPVVFFSLSGDVPPHELQHIAITEIIPRLEDIDGVLDVGIEGGSKDEVLVSLDPEKMNEFGISMSQVEAILAAGEYSSLSEIENADMETDALVLGDVAGVNLGPPPETAITRTNGKPSVAINVRKDKGANIVTVANAVVDEAEKIGEELGDDVEFITVGDQSELIERSISELTRNAIIGGVLAIIVAFLFLMAFRASLVTAISIPLSLLIGFLLMWASGITINMLTLSAMVIAVGRVIDNSIVLLEVIFRRMQQGEGFREAAIGGAKDVAAPITSATLATVAIFIPLAFIGGIVGELFVPFALTITFALAASLLVALTIVPALSNFTVSRKAKARKGEPWYLRVYTPMLKWALGHRALTLLIAAALFFGSFGLFPFIGTSFLPSMSEKMLTIDVELPQGTDLISTQEVAMQVEEILGEKPEVFVTYDVTVGTSASVFGGFSAMGGGGTNTASVFVSLDQDADVEGEADELRHALEGIGEEASFTVSTGPPMMSSMTGGSRLDISIRGENREDIDSAAKQLFAELETMDGLAELEVDFISVEPKLDIEPDPAKIATSGLPPEQLERLEEEFRLMMRGGTVAQASLDGETYDVFLDEIAQDLDSEMATELRVGWPVSVALGDIATVEFGEQPTNIRRVDQMLAVSIDAEITKKNVGAVDREVQGKIDDLRIDGQTLDELGVEVEMGGVIEMMEESFSSMYIAIIVAIALAFAVLVVSFRSFINALIIMMSLPLASIGAFLGLLIAGRPLGISAMMGVLMLVGIVLTNAIVLVTLVEQLRKRGLSAHDALIDGGQTRLRPILMTALTTMAAMFPLALGLGEGTLIAAELAIVVIGGLFSSTLLTLLVIPVLYSLSAGLRRRLART
jgi:HAE1 family hydrophobic/amphiphilic exporter-1